MCHGLLTNEPSITRLLRINPFPDSPPVHIRAVLYRYRYSSAWQLRSQHIWWQRERIGEYLAAISVNEASHLSRRLSSG
jgi:hypothetical protein